MLLSICKMQIDLLEKFFCISGGKDGSDLHSIIYQVLEDFLRIQLSV